jgi:hypothetical protein
MHLNKILEQIKRHQSPSEAIDKLSTALEKHEGSLLEKGFTILKSELAANMYEAINGPHFDEEHARYAVEGMENEDGTKGPHWTVEETTSVANQMGINLKSEKHNKWDWYVAMNMIYSDYYKAVVAMTGSANTKHFAELAKAWLCDKDIDEGKMWHYYVYLMCDDDENDYKAYERMHGSHSYRSPEYEHRMGRERGYDYEARSYQYPYSRYDREENVVLGICPKVWCRLPKEGVIVLEVRHTAEASGASLPVFISVSGSVSTASNTHNIPLVNASSAPITGSQVSAGNRYIAYFNKCDNVIQLMSYTPAAPTPAA